MKKKFGLLMMKAILTAVAAPTSVPADIDIKNSERA